MANAPKLHVLFCHHKEQQFHQIMSKGYPNGPHLKKKTIVCTEKIHGCSENSVSEEALFAVLHGRYIFSLNISTKPTFILRKSKGNSYSQTCMIFRTGKHSKLARATFVLYMITKWLPSYNCCEITITNFNLFVLSCT